MRVLAAIVVPPHLSVSGGARAGELLSDALAAHCDITVASMMHGRAETKSRAKRIPVRTSVPVVLRHRRIPRRYKSLFYRSDIPDIIASGRYDLVHLHNPLPALEFERIAQACRSSRIPFIISTHGFTEVVNGLNIYQFNSWQRFVWSRFVLAPVSRAIAGAGEIFALSPYDLTSIEALGGSTKSVRIVSNGVHPVPKSEKPNDDEILKRLGISHRTADGAPTYMFLANHTPNKGLPDLLTAFGDLDTPFQLIVGGETREGIDYKTTLRSLRPDQKIVVTGRLSDAEVGACFRRSDVFVFPTLADTFPLVVLEAMAHGKAIIASNVGGIPYQLAGSCGQLVPPGNPRALREAIARLGSDLETIAAIGEAGCRRVRREFTWERAAEAAFAGYEQVLKSAAHLMQAPGRIPGAHLQRPRLVGDQ